MLIIGKLLLSILCVSTFSFCLTALASMSERLSWQDFVEELYPWPLTLWNVLFEPSLNKPWRRATAIALWPVMACGLWLIWGGWWWLSVPAFAIGTPVVWFIGAVILFLLTSLI